MKKLWEKICPKLWAGALIILLIFLTLLFLIFLIVVIYDDPQWIYPHLGVETESGKKYEALKFLGIGMGGLLIALQALMSYRRATAMEDAAKAQAKATEHQAKANQTSEQGQRQERLKNAIEHLGNDRDSVRLGGAYELFHLAADAEDLGQRQTVLDILCAHIRWTTSEPKYREKHQSKPSEEIQSLLTLLFVQKRQVFAGLDINLQESWLKGSDFSQACLEKAVLVRVQLHGADLTDARLHGADLTDARLHGATLTGAQLHGASLVGAQLHGASLGGAQLHGADLAGAQLHGASLVGAQLHGASLMGARLPGAILVGAQLHEAALTGAWLPGVASSSPGLLSRSFEAFINGRIDEESDLSRAIFAGGLTQEAVDSIGTGLSARGAISLRKELSAHIRKPASCRLPKDSGAMTGAYTKEKAAQWIAEYKTATSAMSGSG